MKAFSEGQGKFIVFEGIDGCGKGTQIDLLSRQLKAQGMKITCTAEPTASITGGLIRDCLSARYKVEPYELAALFLADRISHNVNDFDGIKKNLQSGINVICDRYYYSSMAYQGTDCDINWVADMNLNCDEIIKPDLCIFLDVDPQLTYNRIVKDGRPMEIYETDIQKTQEIRRRFFAAFEIAKAHGDNIVCIDAARSVEQVHAEVMNVVKECLK